MKTWEETAREMAASTESWAEWGIQQVPTGLTRVRGMRRRLPRSSVGSEPPLNVNLGQAALDYLNLPSVSFTFSKLGKSLGVGVCSLYCTTPFLSITNAARAAVSPTPASIGKTTSYCLITCLLRSLASVRLIFSFCAQASCANGVSTLMATTSAFKLE